LLPGYAKTRLFYAAEKNVNGSFDAALQQAQMQGSQLQKSAGTGSVHA
jgi:hypothetical protein